MSTARGKVRLNTGPTQDRRKHIIGSAERRDEVSEILELQRLAGNSAVAAVLALQRDSPAATPVKESDAPAQAQSAPPALLQTILAVADDVGADLAPIFRAVGVELTSIVIEHLASNGFRDESKLTDIAFWIHHPNLSGKRLDASMPGYRDLSKEWLELRSTVVRRALSAPKIAEAPAREPAPAAKAQEPEPAPTGEPQPARDDFVKDWARSTLELLPPSKRAKFESVHWGRLDFPGTKVYVKNGGKEGLPLKPDQIEWWRNEPSVKEETDKGGDYFTGVNQQLAGELFLALSRVRPGGGERRVNTGDEAVVPQDAFNKSKEDKQEFYAYITAELEPIDGQPKFRMNREAAQKFAEMRAAAKGDGVPLIALSTFRTLEHEEAAARAAGNPNAVGGISHLIGLAVDVQLHVSAKKDPEKLGFDEATTTMPQMLSMLHSPVHKWIFMNGSKFGFYQYRQEPWHWEYNPPGFRERFYAKAPSLKEKAEEALAAARPKGKKK